MRKYACSMVCTVSGRQNWRWGTSQARVLRQLAQLYFTIAPMHTFVVIKNAKDYHYRYLVIPNEDLIATLSVLQLANHRDISGKYTLAELHQKQVAAVLDTVFSPVPAACAVVNSCLTITHDLAQGHSPSLGQPLGYHINSKHLAHPIFLQATPAAPVSTQVFC